MGYIYIIIGSLLIFSIIGFFVVWLKFDNNNFKNRIFFLLGILSFIGISIFSLSLVFLVNNGKINFQDYSFILTKGNIKEIELKDKPMFYLSGEIISGTTFSGIVYELQGNNFIKYNNSLIGEDLSRYITKTEIKDFYMDSYNKRIEGMQNQINVFLTIITIIGTLGLFLGYKSANLIEEKISQKIEDYLNDDGKGKKIIDEKINEYLSNEAGKNIINSNINKFIKLYIEGAEGKEEIKGMIAQYMEGEEGKKLIKENFINQISSILDEKFEGNHFDRMIRDSIDSEVRNNKDDFVNLVANVILEQSSDEILEEIIKIIDNNRKKESFFIKYFKKLFQLNK